MPTLYVTEQGARIEKEHQRLLVAKEDQVLLATPMARVDHLVLVSNVGVTTPALLALLDADVGLSFVNRAGKLRGRLAPATHKNLELRHRQRDRTRDAGYCLAISRAIVGGKLRNCRTLARRLARTRPAIGEEPFQRMTDALAALPSAADLGVVRGLEGSGSRAYFAVLRQCLAAEMSFDRRTRRPPGDPVNALLSLGYTLLTENLMTACEVVGLDPYDGFLHADKYGRPALALDLVEEFRGVIVDSVVLNLVNRRRLGPDDFEPGPEGGVYLTRRAMRTFFRAYAARLNTEVQLPAAGRPLSYQKLFEVQARRLRRVIEGQAEAYEPFTTR